MKRNLPAPSLEVVREGSPQVRVGERRGLRIEVQTFDIILNCAGSPLWRKPGNPSSTWAVSPRIRLTSNEPEEPPEKGFEGILYLRFDCLSDDGPTYLKTSVYIPHRTVSGECWAHFAYYGRVCHLKILYSTSEKRRASNVGGTWQALIVFTDSAECRRFCHRRNPWIKSDMRLLTEPWPQPRFVQVHPSLPDGSIPELSEDAPSHAVPTPAKGKGAKGKLYDGEPKSPNRRNLPHYNRTAEVVIYQTRTRKQTQDALKLAAVV
ncbi:hypothetical protein IAR50_004573 [Cryptococcus sp. DSM 104548]